MLFVVSVVSFSVVPEMIGQTTNLSDQTIQSRIPVWTGNNWPRRMIGWMYACNMAVIRAGVVGKKWSRVQYLIALTCGLQTARNHSYSYSPKYTIYRWTWDAIRGIWFKREMYTYSGFQTSDKCNPNVKINLGVYFFAVINLNDSQILVFLKFSLN